MQQAYTEGQLSHEEMDQRLDQVLTARTPNEIESALASLPAESPGTTSKISAGAGRIQRRGAWRVPRNLKVHSAFGRVQLDLSRAIFESQVVDIELHLGTGQKRLAWRQGAAEQIAARLEADGFRATAPYDLAVRGGGCPVPRWLPINRDGVGAPLPGWGP